jgi:penicillin-binding protein 2
MEDVVARALARVDRPAAAVVVSLPDRRVVARAAVHGGDPIGRALRPGSTMKPLLAAAAAERGLDLGPFDCQRAYRRMTCTAAHGALDLRRAVAVSCNSYFYDVARRLGPDAAMAALRSFGFGAPTGLAAGEASGFVPAFAPDTDDLDVRAMATATGHGQLRVTLLQLASAYAALSSRMAERAGRPDAEGRALAAIRAGMRDVVDAEHGTAPRARVAGLAIEGKTGTAEPGLAIGPPDPGPDNGYFVAWAPADAPRLVVAVLVEGGGSGSERAAPIAAEILRDALTAPRSAPPASARSPRSRP